MSGVHMVSALVRKIWLAGGDTNSVASSLGTSRAAVAAILLQMDDAELLQGLRANLDGLVQAKAAKSKRPRKA